MSPRTSNKNDQPRGEELTRRPVFNAPGGGVYLLCVIKPPLGNLVVCALEHTATNYTAAQPSQHLSKCILIQPIKRGAQCGVLFNVVC